MTDREKEILNAINEMGVFRTPYPADEVSRLVSKLIKNKVEELEKIKTEIEDMGWDIHKTERKVPKEYVKKERIYELLDNHIKELKGNQ